MKYTPRQMYFFLQLAKQRKVKEAIADLRIGALAAQGSAKAIKSQLAAWKKEVRTG